MRLFFFLLILFIPFSSALNLTLNYPEKVILGEEVEFNLEILENSGEIYDVKIDIFGDGKRISRIFDGEKWQSSMYYVKDSIDLKETFLLKIEDYFGLGEILVKLRDSKEKVLEFSGYKIEIEENEEIIEEEKEKEIVQVEEKKVEKREKIVIHSKTIDEEIEKNEQNIIETIELNPKNFKNDKEVEEIEKKDYSKYPFVIFCILLFFLYIIKPKNKKNEWRN